MRKTDWELADELEEEAKNEMLNEIYKGKEIKQKRTAINFGESFGSNTSETLDEDEETPANLQTPTIKVSKPIESKS